MGYIFFIVVLVSIYISNILGIVFIYELGMPAHKSRVGLNGDLKIEHGLEPSNILGCTGQLMVGWLLKWWYGLLIQGCIIYIHTHILHNQPVQCQYTNRTAGGSKDWCFVQCLTVIITQLWWPYSVVMVIDSWTLVYSV